MVQNRQAQRSDAIGLTWDDLVVSILSVNQYSIERTCGLLRGLREQKVTNPFSLAHWEPQEIEMRLKAAGYDRGSFMTKLLSGRLAALGRLLRTRGIEECESVINSRDAKAIKNLLLPVNGIGQCVLQNFYALRNIPFSGHLRR
jgi:hypothetical protein